MKVVLFCGGYGMRMRNGVDDTIPKPMQMVGPRPLIWHVMRYYAHYGHKEFVLCLGYRGDLIREYFLNYNEAMTNDFVMKDGGRTIEYLSRDLDDWKITFVDTGMHSNIGQRLWRVRKYVEQDEAFLANYADGVSDLPLDDLLAEFHQRRVVASFAFNRAVASLGPRAAAAIVALVPVAVTVFAMPVLDEFPSPVASVAIIGIAVLFGAIFALDLRLIGFRRRAGTAAGLTSLLVPVAIAGLLLAIPTVTGTPTSLRMSPRSASASAW